MGHSLSFYRRAYFIAYMAGAGRIIAEGGRFNYFYPQMIESSSGTIFPLSPLGEIGREFVNFSLRHPDIGIPYTPIAIYIDEYHGTTGFGGDFRAFRSIPYNRGDFMTYNLFNLIFPGGWDKGMCKLERCQFVNNGFGDIFDIILQNASADVLKSYPVILMSGDIHPTEEQIYRLMGYVKDGGILVANSAYFDDLNYIGRKFGIKLLTGPFDTPRLIKPNIDGWKGCFIAYGPDYSVEYIRPILRGLVKRILPFGVYTFSPAGKDRWGAASDVEVLYNILSDGWIVTLVNNDGIIKTPYTSPITLPCSEKEVIITAGVLYSKNKAAASGSIVVTDLLTDRIIHIFGLDDPNKIKIRLKIGPGEIKILKLGYIW